MKNDTNDENKLYLLLTMAMLYVAFKLTCNTLFFRQTNIHLPLFNMELRVVCSAFVYPAIYVISDGIVALSSRKLAIATIIVGTICDGFFSWATSSITSLNLPSMSNDQLLNSLAINQIGPQVWKLYYHGLIAAITAAIAEVIIFSIIFKKIKNFFVSTIISVVITLLAHNTITDYPMLRSDPNAWRIIFNGLSINIAIMALYAALVTILLYVIKKRSQIIKKVKE